MTLADSFCIRKANQNDGGIKKGGLIFVEETKMDLGTLYESSLKKVSDGQILKGKIVKIGAKDVLVDIGYKSEGIIPISEFLSKADLELGKEIDVYVEAKENDEGMIVLSREKAQRLHGWDRISSSSNEGDLVDGSVRRKVKGGFIVDIFGIEAFLPASLSSFRGTSDKDVLNNSFKFKIVKMNSLRRSLIVSRKDALQQEREVNRDKIWSTLEIGGIYSGLVKNITDFGAFIDLGGVDGLLHITDMSWSRISHPSEIVAVGDKIEVMVLTIDKESKKVSLGLKQRMADPWQDIEKRFPAGSHAKGKIVNILPYGVFVELDKGIEGLIHVSEISWQKRNINPQEMFTIGENIEVQVINIDRESRRMSLSIKQLEANPWTDAENKYPIGSKVTGKITGFAEYGAFVELDNAIDGMIHISDLSWTKRITNIQEILKKGQKVEAVILSVDAQNRKISLGIKQLQESPWPEIVKRLPVGTTIDSAVVTGLSNFGVFVKVEEELEGLIYSSEIDKEVMEKLKPGDKIKAQIIKMDPDQAKIGLSTRC
ncbi:MAG: 30S ribosomal protein S1 [Candidatus Omnitrophica bacterium]|nr:30S ribosomal protein S1 [Candidatus Omnitrophota bacterium]MDD5352720.1 30S ribosomal protein S1 [Candidatus Omnitrophota bacterium]